ncbi:alpha-amylase family protein [Nocardiopsis rhodophaea]|uniref:alpha-amylase n=2 Tax=Nocardiopsis rhodophaea TaxID=280238 RepID=UPI0031E3C355
MKPRRRPPTAATAPTIIGAGLLLAVTSSATPALPPTATTPAPDLAAASATIAPETQGSVIVHLFQWRWESVARECADVLGPNGYGAVQVSPPQEHVVLPSAEGAEYPWWQDYQAVSYKIDNTRRGTAADFAAMVETCRESGVKVYVDAIVNHTTGPGRGTGSAGSSWQGDAYAYPAVPYTSRDFNDCRHDIADWNDPDEVWNCELLALRDLKTSRPNVRTEITDYLNGLIDLGVAGFRIDAAKHIPATDLQAIYAGLHDVPGYGGPPYVYQEVKEGGGPDAIKPWGYTPLGDVTDFRFHATVGTAVRDGRLNGLLDAVDHDMAVAADEAVVFIDNHDTQRDDVSISYQGMGARHDLAQTFMLAQPYGTPKVMSSYHYTHRAQGPPSTGTEDGNPAGALTATTGCDNARWFCEHRNLNAMPTFPTAVGSTPAAPRTTDGDARLAFDRGARGFAAFNATGTAWRMASPTNLPDGTYCDVANGPATCTSDSATAITVDEGQVTATLPANGTLAIHVDATPSVPSPQP